MGTKYELKERTPTSMQCFGGMGCPAIYEVTPKDMICGVGPCPAIFDSKEGYLIIGTKLDQKEFGLEKKVAEDEVLIRVPKRLIDEMQRVVKEIK